MLYLSAMMNMDPLCCRHVPLLLMWFLEMLRGCGNPEWYHVPCQLNGNRHWPADDGNVVKPILINAKQDKIVHKLSDMIRGFLSENWYFESCWRLGAQQKSSSIVDNLSIKMKRDFFRLTLDRLQMQREYCWFPESNFFSEAKSNILWSTKDRHKEFQGI